MGALAVRRLPVVDEPPRPGQPRLFALPGGAATAEPGAAAPAPARPRLTAVPTLDDAFTGAWRALEVGRTTACLSCGEAMTPRWTAGAGVVGGRCGGCGALLD